MYVHYSMYACDVKFRLPIALLKGGVAPPVGHVSLYRPCRF